MCAFPPAVRGAILPLDLMARPRRYYGADAIAWASRPSGTPGSATNLAQGGSTRPPLLCVFGTLHCVNGHLVVLSKFAIAFLVATWVYYTRHTDRDALSISSRTRTENPRNQTKHSGRRVTSRASPKHARPGEALVKD